jgi:BirA family biotin operon repressor/biotin-[acetyl-CoA-carboxylase] ligase
MAYERLELEVLEKSLQTSRFGRHIAYYEETSSTNVLAGAIARAGCPEGQVVIAETQTSGKGRLGRSWDSPAGKNLYLSMILRPNMKPTEAAQLTLLAAVAVADTLREFVNIGPRIKWPNDVLLSGRKACGILCELATDQDRVDFVIVGIGVNLNYARHQMPPAIRDIATSVLEESGQEVDREYFTKTLIENLESRYLGIRDGGFKAVARSWNEYARIEGQWMVARVVGEREFLGKALGLDENGFLLLESAAGVVTTISSGEVSLLGRASAGRL